MRCTKRGFTLIELLIVLGILATIVVPQFTDASTDAKLNSLKTNLQTIRGQLEVYKFQHNEALPTFASFVAQMTTASKPDGTTAVIGTAGYDLGPYLQSVPNNPYTGTNTEGAVLTENGSTSWYYNESTSVFKANDDTPHSTF